MLTTTIESAGAVPALPEELHPIAHAARDLPARTWGVAIWPDEQPTLAAAGLPNSVVAAKMAAILAAWYGQAVFVVYRCPTAVTVHTRDMGHRPNTLGTLPVAGHPAPRPLPDRDALIAHIHELGDPGPLHEYAERGHRAERTHVNLPA